MTMFRFFTKRVSQFLGVLLIVFSFYFFFNQPEVKKIPFLNFGTQMMSDFFDDVSDNKIAKFITSVFSPNSAAVEVNTQEAMVDYKLQLVSKGLKSYFQNFLAETNRFLLKDALKYSFSGDIRNSSEIIKNQFKDYMKGNKDILEVSFFNSKGVKMLGVKYSKVKEYSLSPFLLNLLKHKDNLLIKGVSNGELVLVSAVKDKQENLVGYISQTLNPSFFVKILDFLNVGHDNLFYMKTGNDSVVVDNFKAYSFSHKKEDEAYLFQAYKELRFSKEKSVQVNAGGVEYSVGMIIDKNNMLGNVFSFILLILVVYFSVYLLSLLNFHLLRLIKGDAALSPIKRLSFKTKTAPTLIFPSAETVSLKGSSELRK